MNFYLDILFTIILAYLFVLFFFKKNKFIFLYIAFAILFIVQAFKDFSVGSDSLMYIDYFKQIDHLSWHQIFNSENYTYIKSELGYLILNKLLTYFTDNPLSIFVIETIAYLSSVYILTKKYSTNLLLTIFLFFVCYWFQSFYVLRQYLAIAICIFSIKYIIERKLMIFILLMILAFSMHKTSLIFMPAYFVYNIKLNLKGYLIFLLYGSIIIGVSYFFLRYFVSTFGGYSHYLDQKESGYGNLKMLVVYLFYIISYIIIIKDSRNQVYSFFYKLLIVSSFNQVASISFIGLQRLNLYYSIYIIILIPFIISNIKAKPLKYVFLVFTICLFSYILLNDFEKSRYIGIVPYKFMFN